MHSMIHTAKNTIIYSLLSYTSGHDKDKMRVAFYPSLALNSAIILGKRLANISQPPVIALVAY